MPHQHDSNALPYCEAEKCHFKVFVVGGVPWDFFKCEKCAVAPKRWKSTGHRRHAIYTVIVGEDCTCRPNLSRHEGNIQSSFVSAVEEKR